MDGGVTFSEPLTDVTFGRVDHCVTDLTSRHVCLTQDLELLVIAVGVGDYTGTELRLGTTCLGLNKQEVYRGL